MSTEIYKDGNVVGITDREYNIKGSSIIFDDILVNGDMSGKLEYNGIKLRVKNIDSVIAMDMSLQGPRGPVWKGVECEVVDD